MQIQVVTDSAGLHQLSHGAQADFIVTIHPAAAITLASPEHPVSPVEPQQDEQACRIATSR